MLISKNLFKEVGGFINSVGYVKKHAEQNFCLDIKKKLKKEILFYPKSVFVYSNNRKFKKKIEYSNDYYYNYDYEKEEEDKKKPKIIKLSPLEISEKNFLLNWKDKLRKEIFSRFLLSNDTSVAWVNKKLI
jgi:hypothetical protein